MSTRSLHLSRHKLHVSHHRSTRAYSGCLYQRCLNHLLYNRVLKFTHVSVDGLLWHLYLILVCVFLWLISFYIIHLYVCSGDRSISVVIGASTSSSFSRVKWSMCNSCSLHPLSNQWPRLSKFSLLKSPMSTLTSLNSHRESVNR